MTEQQLSDSYQAWARLGERIGRAQTELRKLLATRGEASKTLAQAGETFQQAKASQARARRTREAARQGLHQLVTINPGRFDENASSFRELDETRDTQVSISGAAQDEAFRLAASSRVKATEEFLKALSAMGSASGQVKRELRQARAFSRRALAVRDAAARELESAQGILQQLLLSGQIGTPDSDIPSAPTPAAQAEGAGARSKTSASDLRVSSAIRRARLPDRRDEYLGLAVEVPRISGELAQLGRELRLSPNPPKDGV